MATQVRRPSGQDTVDWTPSAGQNYQCVSDESDATYVYLYEAAGIDYYTYDAFDFTASSINKLSCTVRYKDDGSSYIYSCSFIINGSYYYGDVKYPGTGFAEYTHDFLTNPDTASAWTKDEMNGIGTHGISDWRLKGDADSGVTVQVSEYALTANYEPVAAGNPYYAYAQQ